MALTLGSSFPITGAISTNGASQAQHAFFESSLTTLFVVALKKSEVHSLLFVLFLFLLALGTPALLDGLHVEAIFGLIGLYGST